MNKLFISIITGVLVITGFTLAYSQSEPIPQWIKNNAGWWSNGEIEDYNYIESLQYLISQGIIEIPIKQVHAIDTNIQDSERAKSFVFTLITNDGIEHKFYTFSVFEHLYDNLRKTSTTTSYLSDSDGFILKSVPSLDKKILYDTFNKSLNMVDTTSKQHDTSIDILNGNGQIIQTWEYRDCEFLEYNIFVDYTKEFYKFSGNDEPEIQEQFIFTCLGYSLIT